MVLHGEHEKNLTTTKTMSTTKGVTKFGLNTFHKAVGGGQNGIFANTSVVSVLGMTMLGAKGDTVSQIKASLSDSSTSRDRSVSPMEQGHLDLSNGEDEVDGMVLHSTPGTHMDTVESVGSSGKDVYSSHSGKMHRLSKMKKKFKASFSSDENKWSCEDEGFHTELGEVITFDHAMSQKKSQPMKECYTLKSANRIYLKKNGNVLKGFLSACEKMYHSKPEVMNFAASPDKCRHEINTWVEKHTNGRIKDLLAPGTVSPDTSILIVNAIYFKGTWADKFDPALTRKSQFYTLDGQVPEISFMFKHEEVLYKSDPDMDCQVVELPYLGGDVSFLLILPNQTAGLIDLEQSLNASRLADLTSDLYDKDVILYLPKFKIEVSLDLAEVLQNMGIVDLFNPTLADLSGIDPKGKLYVSNIIHKAFIEVNEEGSEAAGATAEILMAAGAPKRRTVVKADHPFMFLIKDNRSGVPLFLGKYCYP